MKRILRTLAEKPPLCGRRCHTYTLRLLWAYVLLFPVYQYWLFGFDFTRWDLLLFSGVATFILGLRLVAQLPSRLIYTLDRLERRQVLRYSADERTRFMEGFIQEGEGWARIMGLVGALAIALSFIAVILQTFRVDLVLLGVIQSIGGYICGNYLGRMVGYGRLGHALHRLDRSGGIIAVDPLHVDGVGGFKPVGDFFFFQAAIASLPAIFLGVWWFMFPFWPRDYTYWQDAYLWLFIIALVVEVLAFLVPILSFHRIMVVKKREALKQADLLSYRIHNLQYGSKPAAGEAVEEAETGDVAALKERYWAYENMPTWPVDVRTWKRFRLHNLLLLIPLLADIGKRSVDWKQLANVLNTLLT